MTWTLVKGAKWPVKKGLGASGPKGLEPTYCSILFYFSNWNPFMVWNKRLKLSYVDVSVGMCSGSYLLYCHMCDFSTFVFHFLLRIILKLCIWHVSDDIYLFLQVCKKCLVVLWVQISKELRERDTGLFIYSNWSRHRQDSLVSEETG